MDELDALYTNILIELECPVCTLYMSPPIRQCETGHSICEPCMKKLFQCPLCQTNFINAKNISLEALARKVHYPCINQSLGCNAKFMLEERDNHEKDCSFKGFKCAMEKCAWIGRIEEISRHWASKKSKCKALRSSNNICKTKIVKSDSYYCNLVEAHSQLFWFKRKLEKGKMHWAVQFIGQEDRASDYFYEVEVFKSNVSKRTVLFRGYCQSVEIDNNNLFNERVCVTVNTDCLARFIDDDQLLNYYLRVYECESSQ